MVTSTLHNIIRYPVYTTVRNNTHLWYMTATATVFYNNYYKYILHVSAHLPITNLFLYDA